MTTQLTICEEIEYKLLKYKQYNSNPYKLLKFIETAYIKDKITKKEKYDYETELYKLILENNSSSIVLYDKKRDEIIEQQRKKYLSNPKSSLNIFYYYKKIVNYIYDFLYKFNNIFF